MPLSVKAWHNLKAVIKIFLLSMCFLSLSRLIVILTNLDSFTGDHDDRWSLLQKALSAGFRFDLRVSSSIVLVPALLIGILFIIKGLTGSILGLIYLLTGMLSLFSFLLFSVDIPALHNINDFLSDTIFCGREPGQPGFQMVLPAARFYIFLFAFLLESFFYVFILTRVLSRHKEFLPLPSDSYQTRHYALFIPLMLLSVGILYLGTRVGC